jgi:alkylhydroperoxidase family enzyme
MGTHGKAQTGRIDFDIDARERQVIGDGPRFPPLSEDDIDDDAKATIMEIRGAFNIPDDAPMPMVSLISLRHPGMFRGQMALGVELAGRGAIPPREREIAILRIALLCGAPFEWSEHVDIGRRFGVTDEEIERVIDGSAADGWSEHERAILRGVEELIADKCLADETWDTLARTWNDQQLMELPMLVGSYFMTALQQNTLRIPPKAGFRYR